MDTSDNINSTKSTDSKKIKKSPEKTCKKAKIERETIRKICFRQFEFYQADI